jgi:hypothetical protein
MYCSSALLMKHNKLLLCVEMRILLEIFKFIFAVIEHSSNERYIKHPCDCCPIFFILFLVPVLQEHFC